MEPRFIGLIMIVIEFKVMKNDTVTWSGGDVWWFWFLQNFARSYISLCRNEIFSPYLNEIAQYLHIYFPEGHANILLNNTPFELVKLKTYSIICVIEISHILSAKISLDYQWNY